MYKCSCSSAFPSPSSVLAKTPQLCVHPTPLAIAGAHHIGLPESRGKRPQEALAVRFIRFHQFTEAHFIKNISKIITLLSPFCLRAITMTIAISLCKIEKYLTKYFEQILNIVFLDNFTNHPCSIFISSSINSF